MALDKITLGIDLGTTYSAIAYVDEYGEARIITNDQTERITPSVVYFDADDKDSIIVGQTAKDNSVYKPDEVVSFVKREMGKHKDDVRADDNYGVPKPYDFHGKRYAPEEVSALILKKLKLDAENYFQGRQITDAIITVPAYFNDSERKATLDAGKMAGLNVLRVINEPTAAAIAYGVTNAANRSQKVFVFDLGGGTFDVTILDVLIQNNQKEINIINTDGDHRLGGKDWDDKLIDFVSEKFIGQFGEDPRASPEGLSILREQSEKAKKALSSKESAKIIVRTEENTGRYEISRDQFEELTIDLVSRIEGLCVMVLKDANLSWASIDTILLAGGTTRMPMIKKLLERISGKEVRTNLINPDECVALGAAIQATITQIETGEGTTSPVVLGKLGSVKVHDVLSHSLGNIAIDHYTNQPKVFHILKKGTTVPCQNMGRFVTLIDYQTGVNLTFTEGESENPANVVKIQEAYLQIVTPLPKGAPLEVTFSMSADGMLTVIAKDVTNNKFITVIIERKGNLTPAEIENGVSHLKTVDVSS